MLEENNIEKNLRDKCYEMGNSKLPLDVFYNDIRDNKASNFNKEEAYADLEKIVDYIAKLLDENIVLRKSIKSWNENAGNLLKENTLLKKGLEFLVKGFYFKVEELTTINGESEYYLNWQDKFSSYGLLISKEKYELLKVVFKIEEH